MAQAVSTRGPVTGTATAGKKRRKLFLLDLYGTAVGKKYAMALTGIAMMGFVLVHMIGNLKMYLGHTSKGQYHIDEYGEFLRNLLVPILPRTVTLWLLRVGLIGAFGVHIGAAASLTRMNAKARPVKYQSQRDYVAANFASRTMRVTGIIFALFLLWHLSDLTWGFANHGFVRGEVMRNLHASLSRAPIAAIYIVGNVALGVHLFHGSWSLFQSLGLNNPRFNRGRQLFAAGFAALIVAGNLSFPIAWVSHILKYKAG